MKGWLGMGGPQLGKVRVEVIGMSKVEGIGMNKVEGIGMNKAMDQYCP